MEDSRILALYWQRDESAIRETRQAYGKRLLRLAERILRIAADAEECESDTYLAAWNAIPPAYPEHFFAYLAKICRNLAFRRLEYDHAAKRSAEMVELSEEMQLCIPDAAAERKFEEKELADLLNGFLAGLKPESRAIFIRRYFLMESIAEIAGALGMRESKIKSSLFRSRKMLLQYLQKEGIRI